MLAVRVDRNTNSVYLLKYNLTKNKIGYIIILNTVL